MTFLATWLLGIGCELVGLYKPDGAEYFTLIPSFRMTDFSALEKTVGACFSLNFIFL